MSISMSIHRITSINITEPTQKFMSDGESYAVADLVINFKNNFGDDQVMSFSLFSETCEALIVDVVPSLKVAA